MSKTIKQSLVILIVLLVISVAFALFTYFQKTAVEKQNEYLQGQLTETEAEKRKLSIKTRDLTQSVEQVSAELAEKSKAADELGRMLTSTKKDLNKASSDLDTIKKQNKDFNKKLDELRKQRDNLTKQIATLNSRPPVEKIVEKIVYRDRPEQEAPTFEKPQMMPSSESPLSVPNIVVHNNANEEYWASVMRAKAAVELELADVKNDLEAAKLKVADISKVNSDLELEIGRLKTERDQIIRKIKYGEDLADNLSVELARARNDQKMSLDRADKVETDNKSLRSELKQMSTTKVALERSISRLTDEKLQIEKKLVETENIIQNRIDEIWNIKKDIDSRFDARGIKVRQDQIELPPIVVNASETSRAAMVAPAVMRSGAIVSVNKENNFVIIDMGADAGIRVGDKFKVYHSGSYVGAVSVIQVRKDISAADIKQQQAEFQPGDIVK